MTYRSSDTVGSGRTGCEGHHRWLAELPGIERLGYGHEPRSQRAARARGEDSGSLLSGVHSIASLVKRWLLGTHQGAVTPKHLESYLNVLLRWTKACATSVGAPDRQWRTGSLELTVTPRTYVRLRGVLGATHRLSSRRERGLDPKTGVRRCSPRTGGRQSGRAAGSLWLRAARRHSRSARDSDGPGRETDLVKALTGGRSCSRLTKRAAPYRVPVRAQINRQSIHSA